MIVGGGISGLATAHFLQKEGAKIGASFDCTIIESEDRLGGNIQTKNIDGIVMEAGPDSFFTPKPQALDLCEELGLAERLVGINPARSRARVFVGGKLRTLPEGLTSGVPTKLEPFLTSELLTPWGKFRMLCELLVSRRGEQGDESLASFIRRRFGTQALERIGEPLMAGIYAGDAEQLSTSTNFPQLVKLEVEHRSLILGMLSTKRDAPPIRDSSSSRPMFMTLRGGLQVMVDALVSQLKNTAFITKTKVINLRTIASESCGYELELNDGRVINADCVVLATPAYISANILRQSNPSSASILKSIPYVSTATVSLVYNSSSVLNPLDGSGFVVSPVEKRKITACTWVSSKWPTHSPPGKVLLRCFLGRAGDEEILNQRDDEICKTVREELRSILGISAEPLLSRVCRFANALPQYNLGHGEKLAQLDHEMASLPGVFLTGAAYRGVGLPDCIKQGALTAKNVVSFLDREMRIMSVEKKQLVH